MNMNDSNTETLYLNIYETPGYHRTISHYHATRIEADEAAKARDDRVSCIRIEYRKDQFDTDDCFYLNINEYGETYTLSQELYNNREEADSAKTRSSKRFACIRVPVEPGRYDD